MRETPQRKLWINKLFKPLGAGANALDERPYWPRGRAERVDHMFLFLLTPPNSGSTEIAQHMVRRGDIGGLYHNFEGQRLIKGLMDTDRWWPEKFIDFEAVLGAWNGRIAELDAEGRYSYWLEKSPPNLVRHKQLFGYFPQHRAVVNNRAPMANVASQLRRYLIKEYHGARRALVIRHLARIWQWRSERLMAAARQSGYPCVTYERFCARPDAILEAFGLEPTIHSGEAALEGIVNLNAEHAQLLSEHERGMVAEELSGAGEVLEFFGYDLNDEL
ncbi:hypothetical protein EDF56_102185 [Novosphingobium sp. PhB165]|uniref:hypothetical protein n=1 Tax=Novosphingobium sp. PhB165 TaxID=2485105 RepID=UPI00104B29B8|nr:hypothetical protein [Novosphingobium sp. PhB165]TCM20524.1 hypothetical protein EDF56_102185 [Novosphingobium sp. PhB165]